MRLPLLILALQTCFIASAAASPLFIQSSVSAASFHTSTEVQGSNSSAGGLLLMPGFEATLDYDTTPAFDIEVGSRINEWARLSYSVSTYDLRLSAGKVVSLFPPIPFDSNIASIFNYKATTHLLNGYFDLPSNKKLQPYFKLSAGITDVSRADDLELSWGAGVGMNYDLTDSVYVGARGDYLKVSAPTDKVNNIRLKDISVTTLGLVLGKRF